MFLFIYMYVYIYIYIYICDVLSFLLSMLIVTIKL